MLCLLQILTQVTTQRLRIVDETDSKDDENDDDTTLSRSKEPSAEALAKIADYSKTQRYAGFIYGSLFFMCSDTLYI